MKENQPASSKPMNLQGIAHQGLSNSLATIMSLKSDDLPVIKPKPKPAPKPDPLKELSAPVPNPPEKEKPAVPQKNDTQPEVIKEDPPSTE